MTVWEYHAREAYSQDVTSGYQAARAIVCSVDNSDSENRDMSDSMAICLPVTYFKVICISTFTVKYGKSI